MSVPPSGRDDGTPLDARIRRALYDRADLAEVQFGEGGAEALREEIRQRIAQAGPTAETHDDIAAELRSPAPFQVVPAQGGPRRRPRAIRTVASALLAAATVAGAVIGLRNLAQDPAGRVSTRQSAAATNSTAGGLQTAPTGQIVGPRDGDGVGQCAIIFGTADLPADDTIVLAYQYTNNPAATDWYFEFIRGSDSDRYSARWGGAQFFGSSSNAGSQFRLVALAMNRAQAKDDSRPTTATDGFWHAATLPASATVLDEVRLVGTGAAETPTCLEYDDRDPAENPTPTHS